jgi:hypothetical protein
MLPELNRVFASGLQALQSKAQQFNENMVRFYLDKDATEMMAFLVHCHPDAEQIQGANQNPPVEGRDA